MSKGLFKNIWKNKNFLSIFLSLLIFGFVFFLYSLKLGEIVDKNIQKSFFNYDNGFVDDKLVLVSIDENTTDKLGRFPFDREVYTKLIENLNKAGASVIGFDIIFADKTSLMSDSKFAKAMSDAGNVIIGGGTLDGGSEAGTFEKPLESFIDASLLVGSFNVYQDPLTNIVFSVIPFKNFANGYYEYFGLSILRAYYSKIYNDDLYLKGNIKINNNNIIINNNLKIPLSLNYLNFRDVLINFTKTPFNRYSFIEIYDDEQFSILQKEKGKNFLKDRIVVVGATLRGIDIIKTPVSTDDNSKKYNNDYGVYVHANFINTVLSKNFSRYFSIPKEMLLIFLLTILSIYLNLNKGGLILLASNISIFGILIIYYFIIVNFNLVLSFPFELFLSFILALLLSNIVKYLIENKDKTKLNKALSEYVSKDIAAEILSGEGVINLDGEKKRIVIFFSDIEGFTTISENFTPEKLISYLKDYLNEMSSIIINERGWVSKYEGDSIMALWGVFNKTIENISFDACSSALLQKQKLIELNNIWEKKGLPKINVRIGIHLGEAIIGNIGSVGKKMEFTAIGDNVNLASRLESINKHYGTFICVSEAIFQDTKDFFEFRYLDKIKVKGKNNAVNIYELLNYKGKLSKIEIDLYEKFQKGIDLYLKKKFNEAGIIFEELSKLGDKPSRVYKDRCDDLEKAPIEDWDGIWVMHEK